jgi:hypothetical protein
LRCDVCIFSNPLPAFASFGLQVSTCGMPVPRPLLAQQQVKM